MEDNRQKIEVDSGVLARWNRVKNFASASWKGMLDVETHFSVHSKRCDREISLLYLDGISALFDELHRYIFEPETGPFHSARRELNKGKLIQAIERLEQKPKLFIDFLRLETRFLKMCRSLVKEYELLESFYQDMPATLPAGLSNRAFLCFGTIEEVNGWTKYIGRILGERNDLHYEGCILFNGNELDGVACSFQQAIESYLSHCRQFGYRSGLNPLLHYVDFSTIPIKYSSVPVRYKRVSRYPGCVLAGITEKPISPTTQSIKSAMTIDDKERIGDWIDRPTELWAPEGKGRRSDLTGKYVGLPTERGA